MKKNIYLIIGIIALAVVALCYAAYQMFLVSKAEDQNEDNSLLKSISSNGQHHEQTKHTEQTANEAES